MSSLALFQPVVVAFLCGLALFWVGGLALRLARGSHSANWRLLGLFAMLQALAQWSVLSAGDDSRIIFGNRISLALSAVSFLALMEWGRREVKRQSDRKLPSWIYGLAAATATLIVAVNGTSGIGTAVGYALAAPGGVLAAIAFAQAAQRRADGGGLALAGAAVALFAIGYMFSVGALEAFAAFGLLIGIWRENRQVLPLPPFAGVVQRWRTPAVFVLLAIVGAAGTLALFGSPGAEVAAGVALVPSSEAGAGDAQTVEKLFDAIEVDPRELARQRADEQRYRQGLTILIVLGVVAVAWAGLARYSGAK
jgi:hypothetical protein